MNKRIALSLRIGSSLMVLIAPLLPLAFAGERAPSAHRLANRTPPPAAPVKRLASPKTKPPQVVMQQGVPQVAPGQSATLLADGSWLLTGGEGELMASAAIVDAQTGEIRTLNSKLRYPRTTHSATVLPNGTVLILGGVGSSNEYVQSAEIFNPDTETFEAAAVKGLIPRANHTATLLTDGQLLIAGGVDSKGKLLTRVELWNPQKQSVTILRAKLTSGRQKHVALLQADGSVVLSGGFDEDNNNKSDADLYQPESKSFLWTAMPPSKREESIPNLEFSTPNNGAMEVDESTLITLRFSKPLSVKTVSRKNVVLQGPRGEVETRVVAAESGMLMFITPLAPLASNSNYNLSISGAADKNDQPLPFIAVGFKTKQCPGASEEPCGAQPQATDFDTWIPDAKNLKGDWRSGRPASSAQSLPALQAPAGETALAGQVLTLSGNPLANVTLQVGDRTATTDATGRFLLSSLTSGRQVLTIQGHTASRPGKMYGTFDVLTDIVARKTTVLPYTIWLPVLDEQNAIRLPVPTSREISITTPRVPGMEVRIPSSAVLRMPAGKHHMHGMTKRELSSMAITPIPIDRPPFPLPAGVEDGLLFTLQLHGAKVEGLNGEKRAGLRLVFPNYQQLPAGTRVDFWNYDSEEAGWYMYGHGTVTADARQVVPDPGVELQSMHCISLMNKGDTPGSGPHAGDDVWDGDPVDLSTGLFVYNKIDMVLSDVLPISLERTYRQNDSITRSFGKGSTNLYDMYVAGDTYNYGQIVMPDGGLIRFDRIPNSNPFAYQHTATPTRFYKATMRQVTGVGPNGAWEVRLTDGTIYQFGIKVLWGDIFGPHSTITALSAIQDRYGNRLTIIRDDSFRMIKVISPNGRWIEFGYSDTSKRIAQATDNIGRVVSYTYDASGRLWKVTNAKGGITEYTYDSSDRMLTIKDPRNIVFLTNEYDTQGRIFRQTQADSSVYQFAYTVDGSGKITQTDVTDPRGFVRRVTFNANGYSLTDTSALGRPEQQTYVYERQAATNLILSITDPLNRKTAFTYNAQGRAATYTRLADTPGAVTVSATFESQYGQVAAVTDPLSHTNSYAYDVRGKLASVTDALGNKTTFKYNAAAEMTAATGPVGNTTSFVYELGNLVEVIDPMGHRRKRGVDAAGRMTSVTDPLGSVARYEYDNHNHHVRWTDPLLGETEFTRDANGNLLTVVDASDNVTTYTYDSMNRILSRQDQLQHTETYEYDLNGNLKKVTDRKGQVTNFIHDALNRLAQVTYADASTTTYTYDSANRVTQIVDSLSGTINYSYDDLDRLASETTPQGIVNYTHDAANRRTSMTVGGQPAVNYTYDNANRLTQVSQGSASVVMAYDAAGRRTSLTLPNGVVTEYTYDLASQLTSLTYKRSGNVLGNLTYEYDAAGRRVSFGGSFAYTVSPQPFSSATYNAANRQLTSRGQTLSYDLNGNLESDGTNTYTWDARGRLASISGPNSTATFQYDALGRRISKTVNGVTTAFLYDGFKVVQEQSVSLGNANLLNGGIDEVFARHDAGGSWSPLRDVLGSYISLSDSAGTLTGEYAYEPFGDFAANSTANSTNSTHYTGRENDGTGLQFNRARYYSPALQRFISEDPIGMRGGLNLYAYAGNNPLGFSDPFGTNPAVGVWEGAILGGEIGSIGGPIGAGIGVVVGGVVGGVVTYYATDAISKSVFGPASCPDPLNPPADWVRHPSGKPDTWIDPNGDTWRWHPDADGKHGGDHWDIGGPKPAGGGKGKQDWWPKGGTREPKPPGSMRFYFPQKLGDPKDIVEGTEFDPNKHDPIDYAP